MRIFSRRPFMGEPNGEDNDAQPIYNSESRRAWLGRPAVWTAIVLFVFVVIFGVWLGIRSFDAKSSLEAARSSAVQAKDALLRGDTDEASRFADDAVAHAEAAQAATHSLPWNIASVVPWLGSPFKTGQQISNVVLNLAADVLRPATDVGAAISPDQLYRDGRVDVQLLRDKEPKLGELSAAAARIDGDARAIPEPAYLSMLEDARTKLKGQTSDIAGLLQNTAIAAKLAPSMMGADGRRTYFMGFQTNAEARGTGGLLGGFGILRFDDGKASVDDLGPNTELDKPFIPVDLGAEFAQQYGWANASTDFRNSNLSAHFPYAAQIWKSMWAQQSGMNVDGAVAIDPIALSYILGAVGSITLPDGEVITKDNVVELTESTAYVRFPTDQTARKQYLQDIANEVVRKITGPVKSPRELLDALGKAVSERRIAVWSAKPDDQAILETTLLGHVIPDDATPLAQVVINNLAGNKMDYYLQREIEYVADGCGDDTRLSTVTVRLKNTASGKPLPDYVSGTAGLQADAPFEVPDGTMITSVRLLATKNASLVSALANGERLPVFTGNERGHPSFEIQVLIPPGKSGELSFHLSEPTSPGAPNVPVQPLVDSVSPKVSVPECSAK